MNSDQIAEQNALVLKVLGFAMTEARKAGMLVDRVDQSYLNDGLAVQITFVQKELVERIGATDR